MRPPSGLWSKTAAAPCPSMLVLTCSQLHGPQRSAGGVIMGAWTAITGNRCLRISPYGLLAGQKRRQHERNNGWDDSSVFESHFAPSRIHIGMNAANG